MSKARTLATTLLASVLAIASFTFGATPGQAAAGLHAAYFSESSFLALSPGDSGQFAVGFTNTGDQAWTKSGTTRASLHTAAPLDNGTDFAAGWASGWAAPNVYAYQSSDLVAPGQIAFFIYNVQVPASAPVGVHNFYGRPATDVGGFLEDYGYYQAVNVQAPVVLQITSTSPASPSTSTTPTVNGTGAPAGALVTVSEGSAVLCTATASATGSFSCVTAALGIGSHTFVASAAGVAASAPFTYVVSTTSTTAPSVTGASPSSLSSILVSFSAAMKCTTDGSLASINTASNYALTFTADGTAVPVTITPSANAGCTQVALILSAPLVSGTSYTITVTNVQDTNGNVIGTSRSAAFTAADSGPPTATASVTGTSQITVTFSKVMDQATTGAAANYRLDSVACTSVCSSVSVTATTATLNFTTAPSAGNHTFDISNVKDPSGATITPNPTTFTLNFGANTSRPTVTGVSAITSTDIKVSFSTSMEPTSAQTVANYSLHKADGSAYGTITSVTCSPSTASCNSVDVVPGTALVSGSYEIVIQQLKDNFGNILNPAATIKTFSFQVDTSPPTITSIAASQVTANSATITFNYSKAMKSNLGCGASGASTAGTGSQIDDRGDYVFARSGTSGPDPTPFNSAITTATVLIGGDCRSIQFTFTGGFVAGPYQVTVTAPQDQTGNTMVTTTQTFTFIDTVKPTVLSVTGASATQFTVNYSKTMVGGSTPGNSSANPNNYKVGANPFGQLCQSGGSPIIDADASLHSFTVKCVVTGTTTPSAGLWTVGSTSAQVQSVTDYNNNIITPNPAPFAF